MLKLWKTQSGTKAQDNSLELALCRIGRDDIIAPQSELTNERRIQRNIYQERQASEEIEAYKAEEDNKLKENIYDDDEITERVRSEDLDQDEAKYSPEEKSIVDKSDMDRTPTPSEESEDDEDVKRSVAERKEQITKKLSSSKIPSSKQKKELREEIIEIKTQIKPDIKKFQDIEQQVKAESKLEQMRFKTSPDSTDTRIDKVVSVQKEQTVEISKEEIKQDRTTEQFRKFDPSSPAKPTPKHLQRHMRNESMRFPSGDFSNVTITPRKSITTETTETKQSIESKIETFTKETISQKEIDSARVEEKLDDGDRSPELVMHEEKDIAEATLKDKINAFETKISKEPPVPDTSKTIKLTKEALKRHTQEQENGMEYTQAFVRDQAKQLSSLESKKILIETEKQTATVKSVRETIQRFDSKIKHEDQFKQFPKAVRTDSTLVQVSSEEDSEFLKKSTDSETETESQTTVKVEKDKITKFETQIDNILKKPDSKDTNGVKKKDSDEDKKNEDDDRKDDEKVSIEHELEKLVTDDKRLKINDEEVVEVLEEKDISTEELTKEKVEAQQSIASTKSDLSKHTKTDSVGSDIQDIPGRKVSQESPLPSGIDKTDSLADLQQSTERDVSFVSQTESKIYSKDSKHRSDSLDEASQFSDLDDQIGMSPAHKPSSERPLKEDRIMESEEQISIIETSRDQTLEFLKYETEHSAQIHSTSLALKDSDKVPTKESPVISAKARQFIETVPEDDSVQECFFSKRIYSDSLEDSDHTDSRRHSEADSLKSDQSDVKAKISSSDFDERAEYEGTADSGSGFGDEKFEESIGFTSIKIDPKVLESQKQDSDSGSTQLDETDDPDIVFKKMAPKRHSRTESVSISKLSDLQDIKIPVAKQEFQMIVTEADDIDKSFDKDEPSDKISSESSREIEISERKSSDGISDRISSEDAVTDKKTSSDEIQEEPLKEEVLIADKEKTKTTTKQVVGDTIKETEKIDATSLKGETVTIGEDAKRQSVTSMGSGSVSELRLEEKRLSDAHSITESKDYTFEESEDDIGLQGIDAKEKAGSKQEVEFKIKSSEKPTELLKLAKLTHGDSLDDVEGFPEDHVAEYVHKLPHIEETSSVSDKQITNQFLSQEREEQIKRETVTSESKITFESVNIENVMKTEDKTEISKLTQQESDEISSSIKSKEISSSEPLESITITTKPEKIRISDDKKLITEYKKGPAGEEITITTVTEIIVEPSGEEIERITVTESTKYPSGKESVSVRVSENIKSLKTESILEDSKSVVREEPSINGDTEKEMIFKSSADLDETSDQKGVALYESIQRTDKHKETSDSVLPVSESHIISHKEEITPKLTEIITSKDKYSADKDILSTKVSESVTFHKVEKATTILPKTKDGSSEEVVEKIILKEDTETDTTIKPKIKDSSTSEKQTQPHEPLLDTKTEHFLSSSQKEEKIPEPEKVPHEDKNTDTVIETKIGEEGEQITITTVTETLEGSSGEEILKVTVTEAIKYPSGKEAKSTKISECVKTEKRDIVFLSEKSDVSDLFTDLDKKVDAITTLEKTEEIGKIPAEDEKTTTTTETVIGPSGEEITTTTVILTKILPTGDRAVKTTITETIKYASGRQTVSTRVSESIESHKKVVFTTSASETSQSDLEDKIQSMILESANIPDEKDTLVDTKEETQVGNAGETITTTVITEKTKIPGGEKVKTTTTEVTKFLSGEESISTRVSESIKTYEEESKIVAIKECAEHETVIQTKHETDKLRDFDKETESKSKTDEKVFDSEILTMSESEKKSMPKELHFKDTQEITKDQVKPVIDDILQKGSIVAAARSPIIDKDIKIGSKEILETEKRSYDAKVPQKEERRHSCISPAISLERIAESEVEMEDEVEKLAPDTTQITKEDDIKIEMKKSDSAMKQMADNIEIIIKQASEDLDLSSEEPIFEDKEAKELHGEVSVDSIIEEAVQTVEGYLDETADKAPEEIDVKVKEVVFDDTNLPKERPGLIKSLSRDSGEILIMPKKKQPRTFSVQSSPDEVEEQIYTDSESDMDKAKVLEIIEPTSDVDGKLPASSFDIKKIRTDSLDDADDFPDKETEYFEDGGKYDDTVAFSTSTFKDKGQQDESVQSSEIQQDLDDDKLADKFVKKTHISDSILRSDLVSKSTTESSVTTVISTLTKSSDEDQKSVLEDATSADLSRISGADLIKDPSKTSMDTKDESKIEDQSEDRGTPDLSKKSMDLTKDYSKSSIDSKDTSRDFASNELSKDSTVDLTKDYSKASIDSIKESSRSIDEKTFSEEQSSFDFSKTLASDASDGISKCKEFIDEERSTSKVIHISTSSSQETSILTESKLFSDHDDRSLEKTKTSDKTEVEKDLLDDILEGNQEIEVKDTKVSDEEQESEVKKKITFDEKKEDLDEKYDESEVPDISELNRRCSNLLEDISAQGAVIRIDTSHVVHDLSSKFSKTPPPSPVDLIMKERMKTDESTIDKHTGLQPKSSESSFLDASRQSPRASSAGDSLISETEAHQSEILTEDFKASTAIDRSKSPTKHLADNISFVNVDKPTITSGAIELVDRTIEKSMDVIDQIKKEIEDEMHKSTSSDTFYSESRIETSTSSSSIHKTVEGTQLKFQSIDPEAVMSDMISKFGTSGEYSTVLSHKETETKKISGQEYFSETKQISSSDDDSLIIKTETSHELRGQEHEVKEKMTVKKEGDQTETSQKKMEKAHEATAKRSDVETKTVFKSTDDTDLVTVEREFSEQGLYTGRQTKSEEKMTALKDETIKKTHEVKISERDLSHEQWGKEYFTQPGELEEIKEDEDSKSRIAFVESSLKIIEKDEIVSSVELSEKGQVVSSKVEHHKEESVIESKEHDDLSSDASHIPSFKSEATDRRDSSESSPKSKSKSFKKDNEVYEVDFIKEIKISTSPVKSSFSRTGSQDTHSESEVVPELPHDDKTSDTPKKETVLKSPVKLPHSEDLILEVSVAGEASSVDDSLAFTSMPEFASGISSSIVTKSSELDMIETKSVTTETKTTKFDMSPSTLEVSDDMSTISKDLMIKSGESIDTECMVKSLEYHEGEILQKSMDSTVSAETLHASEFSTEADSAFLTGTDHKKEEIKLMKEKSTEDICSSGYDTDFSSAEFHGMKLETDRVALDSLISTQPLADLSVLEKTIDEVKQSLEAAQVEIISEKSDGSIKYKQSPSEFQFKILISPDRPEVIKEEPHHVEAHVDKSVDRLDDTIDQIQKDEKLSDSSFKSDSVSQRISSQEETTFSDEDKDTIHLKEPSPPLEGDLSIRSDSGPHSILDTESEGLSDRNDSSKGSPEVKLRAPKHIKSQLGIIERRSASEIESWSSSGESHYHSFEHSESRPLSSDVEIMMTAQSGTDYETALTSHDISSQSLRTSKDYYTAGSSLASRDSMKSLDSDGSSHVASIDISDASETLVPSANELKEELLESSTYVEQFLHESEKEQISKLKEISDEEISGEDEEIKTDNIEPLGKMKRSHEMRFQPKDMIPEHFPPSGTSESTEFDDDSLKDKEGSDTTISSQLKTDETLSSSISKLDMSSSQSQIDLDKEEIQETITKSSVDSDHAVPFSVTKIEKPKREFVDLESEIIPVGSAEYEQIEKFGSITTEELKTSQDDTLIKTIVKMDESIPMTSDSIHLELEEKIVKKEVQDISTIPFPIAEKPPSQREFVDVEEDIIPVGSKQYEEILKSKSDSSVPKTKVEKSGVKTPESQLESKQSSTSSLKTHEHLSTPHTPLSAPSQSSLSTENGREYVLDDMYDISETPELKSDLVTESSRSELLITTEEKALCTYEKEQDSPTSDEFEMVDKPCEMDDFVVIEEVAKEAQESDPEGKSVQIKTQKYVKQHDTEIEEYLSKTTKKQESSSSASGSLSDEELLQYELDQKKLQAQELAEIEAGKRWIQMQFEGDPRYDYERIPLEDIKEEEMTDFDASRIGSLSSQKESIGSYGSFRNSYGSLSESEMASRMRYRLKGENDDISISSLQEFENLERALMEQYQQHSSSSQDSLNGSLPRRYILSKSQGDDISISSLKEFEGLESACLEALKAELLAKQKEALLIADPKVVSGSFLEQEKRSYDDSSSSSPPLKSGSPGQKGGSPSQKSGSPSQKGGSPSQKIGSYGSPSQKLLADSAAIRKIIDQQLALEQRMQEVKPKIVTVKKFDDRGAFFVPEPEPEKSDSKSNEVTEVCTKSSSFVCAAAPSDGSAESIPGDCEEMMKILDQEEKSKKLEDGGVIEIVRTQTVIQQKFIDGKKVSETITSTDSEGGVDIPTRPKQYDDACMSIGSEMSSSLASQPSEMDSLTTVMERHPSDSEVVTFSKHTIITSTERCEDKPEDLEFSREGSAARELSPSSGRSIAHSIISGKYFTDPASGSWSGQDEELSSSGSFSRARADLMLGSTDSLEATSSNATRATYNYEVDTPMTGSLTSGARPPGSNTMVSSLDTLDPVTAVQMESLEHQSTSEHHSQEYEVHEPDSDTERLETDGRSDIPRAKERTIMFDSTDTLSAVSADGSVKEATVEAPAATFYIGDTPIVRGDRHEDIEDESQPTLSGSCPASLPPATQSSPPIPAQRRSLSMIPKPVQSSLNGTKK
ncbi:serine-rich adhesin for platelets-like [Bicyclus anynana]|uniref:Serine-rich adhesin for platelets-like n=1 Tax=Bicyclus anynana TaxID=110368 RepID=A0A6J1PAL9_BICAN|nr:serine-rich adhesin for platelets-like [Bicyclus anynana]